LALLLLPATADAQECVHAPDGLVGWWPLDVDGRDIEGDLDGVLTGGAMIDPLGMVSGALSLNGVDSFVEIPDDPSLTPSSITIDAWVNTNTLNMPNGGGKIVSKYDSSISNGISWILEMSDGGYLGFGVYVGNIGDPARYVDTDSPVLAAGTWHHVAGTFDFDTQDIHVYVDGAEPPSSPVFSDDTSIVDSITPVLIGSFTPANGVKRAYWDGLVDEVKIYNRALSPTEIQAIYGAASYGQCKDEDGDGFRPPEDCDETDPSINPDGIELPGNFVDENCDGSLGDVDPCAEWQNHGKYVRAVAHAVNDLVDAGLLTEEEGDVLVSSAAQSKIGKTGYVPPECP
jgi:hypothetical protein